MHVVPSAEQAITYIRSGQRVFVQGGAATPLLLLNALHRKKESFHDCELIHIHLLGDVPHGKKDFSKSFKTTSLFVGENVRRSLDYEYNDYLPCFLSEIPDLFRKNIRPIDVALIHVSPPDKHGLCSLGTSVDVTRSACDSAKMIIAQVNKQMPRVHGDGLIHKDQIHFAIEVDEPILEEACSCSGDVEKKIGFFVASLVEDGSTIQTGIGKIPNAVLSQLKGHKNLGVHTEVFSDALLPLIEKGVITNSQKVVYPGRVVSSFIIGTQKLYKFIDDNLLFANLDVSFVNNPHIIGKNPKVVAINSAVEIDLTGQICADSIGTKVISGVGGQIDYMRGAILSKNGKPIIALTSRTACDKAKIVPTLSSGAGVVTTRAHAHYIVTEYGIADLYGKTLGERARALINIAHPEDREALSKAWHERAHKHL